MKRRITSIALVIALVAIAVTGATLAYFTDNDDNATNTFTVGNVEIKLEEPNWEASGSQDAPEVYPGEALAKDPTVTNIGANPCFVRVSVTGLDCLGNAGMITYETNYVEGALGEGWVLYNGYFYYTEPLCAAGTEEESWNAGLDDVTTALFDQIRIPTGLENGDGETEYNVVVTAQAVQAQGAQPSWSNVKGMTVEQIAAWFATCGL